MLTLDIAQKSAIPTKAPKALALFLTALWFVPLIWNGLSKELPPGMPSLLGAFYRTSGMFEQSPTILRTYYVQTKKAGTSSWTDLPDELLSGAPLMGRRSRLQLILGNLRQPEDLAERQRLAEWIARRLNSENPGENPVIAVRFFVHTTSSLPEKAEGAWKKPAPPASREEPPVLLSEHVLSP